MREAPEEGVDIRAASPMIMSPTALTNGIRRDKSPIRQGPTFLAAEHFQEIGAPVGRSWSGGTAGQQYGIPAVETVEEELPPDGGKFVVCKAPRMRRPRNCADGNDVAIHVKEVAYSVPVDKYARPAEEKVKKVIQQAQKMTPDEDQVRGCFRETRKQGDTVARYANLIYDMFAQECQPNAERGDQRGDDAIFFRYGTPTLWGSSDDKNNGRVFSPLSASPTPEDAFRPPKSMRYPQAAKIENPVERSERQKKKERGSPGRRDSSEETREDTTDSMDDDDSLDLNVMNNNGEDQLSLREFRLQMYKIDDGQRKVPKARLTRALGELSVQDGTIESLKMKLEDTKLLLREKENRLADAETLCKKHERKIKELIAKALEDKRTLEVKIAREATEKGRLQSKMDVLQKEIYRLKAMLKESTSFETQTASILSAIAKGELKRGENGSETESGTDGEVWEGILSEDDENSAFEVNLRAKVVSLKSQLADSHAELLQRSAENSQMSSHSGNVSSGSRGLAMSSDASEEILRLRQKLVTAEAELAALKGTQKQNCDAGEKVVLLEKKLINAEEGLLESIDQLEEVMAREDNLQKELEEAKEKISTLEKERAASNMDSLEGVEDFKVLSAKVSEEPEKAKNEPLAELEQSRLEVDELKAEVARLTETINEMTESSAVLTEERLKERDRLEEALHRCKNTEHQLRDQIAALEERLEKAKESTLQLVNVSENPENTECRSVKRKLDDSMDCETGLVTRESFQLEEREQLKEQLRRSQAREEQLRSEMAITRQLLHCAQEVVSEMESEMKEDNRLRSDKESRLVYELNSLREKLEASEEKARKAIAARAKDAEEHSNTDDALRQSEAKQQALLNQVHILKTALESVEMEREHERLAVEEERRIHEELEMKRRKEIDVLRVELANVRVKAEKSTTLQSEVDELRVRLAKAHLLSEEVKKSGIKEVLRKDEESSKLRSELSVIKERLATIRKRNAARRQPDVSPNDSSTDDLTASGESVQSLGFSNPNFSPRRMGASTDTSSPSTVTRSTLPRSAESSPWSSPKRPLGSFPSPLRKRVDVASLRQRLVESNQRLQDANTRLSGLIKSSDDMVQEQVRAENLGDEIMTLVAQNSHSDASAQSPDKSFHKKLQIRITENKPPLADESKTHAVRWPEVDEGSI